MIIQSFLFLPVLIVSWTALRKILFITLKGEKFVFFINSIGLIHNVIRHFDIKDDSRIFCSEDSFSKVKDLGYSDYRATIIQIDDNISDLARYNFFTSRFFSAVDIELKDNSVAVVIVTDNYTAPYTVIDPFTHAKQIIGRFRQGTWVNLHITNFRDDLEFKTRDYMIAYNEGSYSGFKALHTLYRNQENEVMKEALKRDLKQLRFFDYLYEYDGKLMINRGMIDNEIEGEKVRQLFSSGLLLENAYRNDAFYNITRRNMDYKRSDKTKYEWDKMDLPKIRKEMVGYIGENYQRGG